LTPQEILYSCCINRAFVKFLTEEFWHQHVTRTYCPQDFGVDKFDSGVLAYLNTPSWTELAKLSFASRRIPATVTARYNYNKRDIINMTFELNFFSSWRDIKDDLIIFFEIPANKYLNMSIKGHIDKNTEVGLTAWGDIGNISSKFGILKWKMHPKGLSKSQVVSQDMEFGNDVHIGIFNIVGVNFFSKIEKIELTLSLADDFVVPKNKKIKFSSTRQETLLSQINTHLLPEEKREGLNSLWKYISYYLDW
jgi:hypothetical protein